MKESERSKTSVVPEEMPEITIKPGHLQCQRSINIARNASRHLKLISKEDCCMCTFRRQEIIYFITAHSDVRKLFILFKKIWNVLIPLGKNKQALDQVTHVFVLNSIIDIYLQKRKRVYCSFVDYKKAFDLVDRSSLWSKLISHGINGKLMSVIFNLYHHAKSCVRANGKMSDYFTCNVGVRQGENLSPLLFAIYLNDLVSYVSRHYNGLDTLTGDIAGHLSDPDIEVVYVLLLYADDTIVMAETPEQLQNALNAVSDYCSVWNVTVNTSKTKIVIFSRGKVRRYPDFVFGTEKLDVVDEHVYFGVKFNYNGNYKKMIAKQITQARNALYCMLKKARKLQLPIDIQCQLFDHLVLPILLYGSEVWGYEDLLQVEVFHRKFLQINSSCE